MNATTSFLEFSERYINGCSSKKNTNNMNASEVHTFEAKINLLCQSLIYTHQDKNLLD